MTRAPLRPSRRALAALIAADPALADVLRRHGLYPGFPTPTAARRETHFAALGRTIIFQQLATAAATTIHGRVCTLGERGRFPSPAQTLALSDDSLAGVGVSGPKRLALRDLAERVEDGRLVLGSIAARTHQEIIDRLVTVRGIGVWSAQMFLIFRLGRLDVMPAGDLGVREGVRRLDGVAERPSPDEVLERAMPWAPLRSVAAWTLWRLAGEPRPRESA
jgi:DNA-3-methyladenine glycosylase II